METSLAEDVKKPTRTLSPDSFFFMSPYRSFYHFRLLPSLLTARRWRRCAERRVPAADGGRLCRGPGGGDPQAGDGRGYPVRHLSAFRALYPRALEAFSRPEKQRSARYAAPLEAMEVVERREIPEQDAFLAMVERAAALTATPEVDKVVLSRLIDITTRDRVDSGALMERLIAQNPASFNFHVPLSDGGVLLGASPELLLRKEGQHFSSLPLAGSARRQPDDVLDREAGNRLLASGKDRHEHELVTQAMKSVLGPRSSQLSLPESPQLITTPTLWHLATPIAGTALAEENAMSLACLLHPTPALSGFPHQAAKRLIAELEPFDRQLFGGIVGWCDDEGNGEWVVTIRCARLQQRTLRLFAGAGIVPASSPLGEWRETGVKLTTMLNVFGLN